MTDMTDDISYNISGTVSRVSECRTDGLGRSAMPMVMDMVPLPSSRCQCRADLIESSRAVIGHLTLRNRTVGAVAVSVTLTLRRQSVSVVLTLTVVVSLGILEVLCKLLSVDRSHCRRHRSQCPPVPSR